MRDIINYNRSGNISIDQFVKNFLFQLIIILFQLLKKRKKDRDSTISAVTNIHTQSYI